MGGKQGGKWRKTGENGKKNPGKIGEKLGEMGGGGNGKNWGKKWEKWGKKRGKKCEKKPEEEEEEEAAGAARLGTGRTGWSESPAGGAEHGAAREPDRFHRAPLPDAARGGAAGLRVKPKLHPKNLPDPTK